MCVCKHDGVSVLSFRVAIKSIYILYLLQWKPKGKKRKRKKLKQKRKRNQRNKKKLMYTRKAVMGYRCVRNWLEMRLREEYK